MINKKDTHQRQWTAYEKNQLLKHGFKLVDLEKFKDKPVQYITGFAEFCGHEFVVNKHTLIPRFESEKICELGLEFLMSLFEKGQTNLVFADVGTGSGCIGLSLFLKSIEESISVEAILSDVSEKALDVAKQNKRRLMSEENSDQIKIFKSDLLKAYPKIKLDLILANLPYIPSQYVEELDNSVVDYEPKLALDGGKDGLDYVRQLIKQAEDLLAERGVIIAEIDERSRINEITLGLKNKDWQYEVLKDENEKQRYLVLRRK